MPFLETYDLTASDIDELVAANPSLRSFIVGYAAEQKLKQMIADRYSDLLIDAGKPDDHDRTSKGDRLYRVGDQTLRIESKSLQSASVKRDAAGSPLSATFQCDASDCRDVMLKDGSTVKTTCLVVGEFDIVAVNLFEFFGTWRFAFAANSELPRTRSSKYTDSQRKELLATSMRITPELSAPFTWDLEGLVGRVCQAKLSSAA